MNTAYGRETRFELIALQQHANGYGINVTERGTSAQSFELPGGLANDEFTDEEHEVLIRAFTIIETRAANKYETLLVSPEEAQARVVEAAKAAQNAKDAQETADKARADAEAIERHATEVAQQTVEAKLSLLNLKEQAKTLASEVATHRAEADAAIAIREQAKAETRAIESARPDSNSKESAQ